MAKNDETGDELVRNAKAGDQSSLEMLFGRLRGVMRAAAERSMGEKACGRTEPSDIAQWTAKSAFYRFQEFEGSTWDEFLAWGFAIQRRNILDDVAAAGRQKRGNGQSVLGTDKLASVAAPGESLSEQVQQSELCNVLWEVAEELSPKQRNVLMLRYQENLSPEDIADILGISRLAVGNLLNRGLQSLREKARTRGLL